jgi:hypothetical protein
MTSLFLNFTHSYCRYDGITVSTDIKKNNTAWDMTFTWRATFLQETDMQTQHGNMVQ